MNSTLKIAVPLALLIAVVFAVTFFSVTIPPDATKMDDDAPADGTGEARPLRFFSNIRRWDPTSGSLADQVFEGVYETDTKGHFAHFWFENRNAAPVTIKLRGVSCSSCSGGEVAAIPPETTRALLQMAAVAALPQGLLSGLPTGMAGPAAALDAPRPTLAWQKHRFDETREQITYAVPAAANADGWSPQWAVLRLSFDVKSGGKPPLRAAFVSEVQGTTQVGVDEFAIFYEPADPFELDKDAIDVGELTDGTPTQTHDLIVLSSTRPALADLGVRVMVPTGAPGAPGPFVTAGTPTRLADADADRLAAALAAKAKRPVRVASAYRIPITIKPKDGAAWADIGRLERDVWVSVGSVGTPKKMTVTGMVRGPVALSDGKEINVGRFRYADGVTQTFSVTTERPGIELAVVPGECRPDYLEVTLTKEPDRGDRGYYKGTVTVPKQRHQGEMRDAVVTLEVKGPTPQRFRIPVRGQGNLQ